MVMGKISKGQRAKCKLALVLSRKAPYLLLDEPFSGIDILTRDEIVDALIRDYQAGEQAVIISTHEIDEIESLVEHVVFIDQGRIQLLGDAEEIRNERGSISGGSDEGGVQVCKKVKQVCLKPYTEKSSGK